jgi:AraC-like DNA-binding protein
MLLKNFLPSPPLQEYVRFFGIVQFLFPPNVQIPPKPYSPRPETSLCFFPKDPIYITYPGNDVKMRQPPITVYGQHTLLNTRHSGQDFLAFIVHFQPGVLHQLTGVPLHELTNTYADAEYIFPKDIKFINECLYHCQSPREMIAVVESFLVKLILQSKKQTHRIEAAAKLLLQHTEHISIDWLTKESCLSTKQFERKFKETTGITASTLARINRFDKTVKLKNSQPHTDWLTIAVQCGYYDYQHLVRDYKDFTGLTPTSYFQLDVQAPESVFGLHEESTLYAR